MLRAALPLVLVALGLSALPGTSRAQEAAPLLQVMAAEENFRAAPSGARLGTLLRDARLAGGESRGQWRQVTLEGWIPAGAVAATARSGYDLAVVSAGGAIHREPGGPILARAVGGLLLGEVAREGDWVRVRRTGWVWGPSLAAAPRPEATEHAAAPPATRTLHAAPSGAAIGTVDAATSLEVVGQEGEWARVRVEGWVRVPAGTELRVPGPARGLSLRALRSDPERYRGQSVAWQVQHVALQRADSLRVDLAPGEPYLLVRDPDGEPGFVYVAVPARLLPVVERLSPLQRIQVVGRVRTGRSELMGHPVLELLELRP